MGSFFCIGLERPKYFYIATDKVVYLKMNPMSVLFPPGSRQTVYDVCVSMDSGVLKPLCHGGGHSWGPGKGLPCPGAWGMPIGPRFVLGMSPRRVWLHWHVLCLHLPRVGQGLKGVHTVAVNLVGGKGRV